MPVKLASNHAWLVPLGLAFAGWAWMLAGERGQALGRIRDLDAAVLSLDARQTQTRDNLDAMHRALIEIRTDVAWIRSEMQRLRDQPAPKEPRTK